MVNRRMRGAQALTLVKKLAHQHGLTVVQMVDPRGRKRGKRSHAIYALLDANGSEVVRFGLTDHPGDLSWTLLNRLEERLAPGVRREVDGEPMSTYDVTVTREDNLWVADIVELTAATDVVRFADLDVEVRDLIVGLTDADLDGLDLRWRYVVNDRDVSEVVRRFMAAEAELREAREQEAAKAAERDAARLAAIHAIRAAGLSQRAAADVVGISHQRVHQLVSP